MKRAVIILYIIVIGLAGWLSYACYCNLDFNSDKTAGIIITTLSIMVTLLVGWQIFSAIEIRSTIARHDGKIKKYETKINQMKNDIKRISIENRNYSKYITLLIKTRDDSKWGDNALFYIDTCEAMKYLLLSGVWNTESNDAEKDLLDLFFALEGCLNELKRNENTYKIKVFNNYSSSYNDLYTTLTAIMVKSPHVDNHYIKLLNDVHLTRMELLNNFGTISREEIKS